MEYITKSYAHTLFKEYPKLINVFPGSKSPFVLLADEWYILANKPFPPKEHYGNYDLVENGVGQFRDFLDRFNLEKKQFPKALPKTTTISIITSVLAYNVFIKEIKPELDKIKNLKVNFFKIENNFFGDSVTVAGLLTGKDIIEQLKDKNLGSSVWSTYRILNDEQTLTLDDMTLSDISNKLGVDFKISNDSIYQIIDEVSNEN